MPKKGKPRASPRGRRRRKLRRQLSGRCGGPPSLYCGRWMGAIRRGRSGGAAEGVLANVRGAATATVIVGHTEYDAQGRRTYSAAGDANVASGAVMVTIYAYDPRSFRLTKVLSRRRYRYANGS